MTKVMLIAKGKSLESILVSDPEGIIFYSAI